MWKIFFQDKVVNLIFHTRKTSVRENFKAVTWEHDDEDEANEKRVV
jgi:hypothetical protein